MKETLRHLDNAIEALRKTHPKHVMMYELEDCRTYLMKYMAIQNSRTPQMFAEYAE